MAVDTRRPSSIWVFALWGFGLLLFFIGERVLAMTPALRWSVSGAGLSLVLGTVVVRWVSVARHSADARGIERAFAIFSTMGLIALALYLVTADPLSQMLGISRMAVDARKKIESVLTCTWIALVLFSAMPMLFAQLALEPMRESEHVEWRRVKSALGTGAALSMIITYATLFTFAASGLSLRADFSYLRTARPSEATIKTARSVPQAIRVLAFFPPVNEVKVEVLRYLGDLAARADNVHLEVVDRLEAPALAKEMNVAQDGTIVILRAGEKESLTLPITLQDARAKLKALDQDFYKSLLRVLREKRTAFLTVGHGELNDTHADAVETGRSADGVKELLERLNFGVRTIGLTDGLATEIPKEATMLLVLGPTEPFAAQEVATIEKYLKGGGHALLALDPEGKAGDASLAALAGVTLQKDILCDDRSHAVRRRNDSDNVIIFTNRFSSHPSVATLSRLGSRALFFVGAGSLEAVGDSHPDFIVRSMQTTYADKNKNFRHDPPEEQRTTWNLAAAVSKKVDAGEMRAVVLADSDALSDAALMSMIMGNGNPQFFVDSVKWLGGEEATLGAMPDTGEDVRIEHTKQKDTALFYGTIFGAPALVLGFGLVYTRRARRSSKRRAS